MAEHPWSVAVAFPFDHIAVEYGAPFEYFLRAPLHQHVVHRHSELPCKDHHRVEHQRFNLSLYEYSIDLVKQSKLNKVMHTLNGNTTLHLYWDQGCLKASCQISSHNCLPIIPSPSPKVKEDEEQDLSYSVQFLLNTRPTLPPRADWNDTTNQNGCICFRACPPKTVSRDLTTMTTPQLQCLAHTPTRRRTGKRKKLRNSEGQVFFLKEKTKNPTPSNSRIHRIDPSVCRRTPPPRGTPGILGSNEEYSPKQGEGKSTTRGSVLRAARRRAYRAWKRLWKKPRMEGMGTFLSSSPPPTKASQTRAKWFRQVILWQEKLQRKRKKRLTARPTIPQLGYRDKLRLGSLNVQGFAESLKLKAAIGLMSELSLDILLLSETKTR